MRPDLVTSMMIDLSTPSTNMRRESAKITKEEVIIINHKSNGFNCCPIKHKPTSKQNQLKFNKSCDLKLDVCQRENDAKVITDQNESRRQSKIGFKPLPKTVIENSDTSRQTSVSRKIKTKCLTELKGSIPDSSICLKLNSNQQNKVISNSKSNCNTNNLKKGLKSCSSLSHNSGFPTKTMKDLTVKKFKTSIKVFDTIQPSVKKTPNQHVKASLSKIARYTPLDKSKNKDAIKGRLKRGEYSTGCKMSTNNDSEYDFCYDLDPSYSIDRDATYNHQVLVRQLDVELIEDLSNEGLGVMNQKESQDELNKLSKIPEVELSLYSDESATNVSIHSIDSVNQSERKLNCNEDVMIQNGFFGATGGKKIQNRDWVKEEESSKIVK